MLVRHADDLGPRGVDYHRAFVEQGEGWLAALAMFDEGAAAGWLTEQDLRETLAFARPGPDSGPRGAFSKASPGVERRALELLAARGVAVG